ncbi:MAG: hypothetical protein AAB295_08365 [Chloroflexota bacterium]
MTYEVWDATSGNLLAHFERYGEALDFLREQVRGLGTSWLAGVALFEGGAGSARTLVAEDATLLPLLRIPDRSPA